MSDIGQERVSLRCPSCGRTVGFTLADVAGRKTIRCSCGSSIVLEDKQGSVRRSTQQVNKALRDLENTIKRFNRKR